MVELQFITHCNDRYNYIRSAELALEGGCRWIQLRMKDASENELLEAGKKVRRMCDSYNATFIIDDHVELVKMLGADGVHLGRNDMPVTEAREILGRDLIIGGTANTIEDIVRLNESEADYIGCGPFRFTSTKKNLSPVLGLDGYRSISVQMKERGIDTPVVAIGGIGYDDIDGIMATGINGIALSGSILNAEDPVKEMQRVLEKVEKIHRLQLLAE